MASIRKNGHSEHSYLRTYAPCVEELGIADAFRQRAFRPQTPAEQVETLTTTAESNDIRDRAILNSGHVDGDVGTGHSGARVRHPNQDTHIFHIAHVDHMVYSNEAQKTTNIRSEHNIVGNTNVSEDSISETIVESSTIDSSASSIHVSGTRLNPFDRHEACSEGPSQRADRISTPEEYAAKIDEMGAKIIETYGIVCCMLPSYVRRRQKDSNELRNGIKTQKSLFERFNSRLPGSIQELSSIPELHAFLPEACLNVVKTLTSLQKQLDFARSFAKRHLAEEGKDVESATSGHTQKLERWSTRLQSSFETYVKATSVFNRSQRDRSQTDVAHLTEIQVKLSTESHASSHLKRFLCLTCPQQCHPYHMAYLSLEPRDPSQSLALRSDRSLGPGSKASYEATWHIAFRSTIAKEPRLNWLKVVSNVSFEKQSQPSPPAAVFEKHSSQSTSITDIQTEADSRIAVMAARMSSKRRASSPLRGTATKLAKQTSGQPQPQDHSSSEGRSGIEICPEYLTWNKPLDSEHAIIKMTDSTVGDHRMFYLSRLTYRGGAKRISLGEAIKHKLDQRPRKLSGTLHWVARTARLIAEAVVRFDLRDDGGTLEESIVFHGAGPIVLDHLISPFIEVKLEKASNSLLAGAASNTEHQQQWRWEPRRHVLLNLGVILVQLGTHREDASSLGTPPTGPKAKQGFILSHAAKTRRGVDVKYEGAVRSCASLFDNSKVAGEEVFLESFLKMVVQPLRDCEENLVPDVATSTS